MKKCLYLICMMLINGSIAFAQDPVIVDSLNELLTKKAGADRYLPLYELAFEYVDRDNGKALEIIEEARKAALLSGDSLWIVKSMRVKAQMLARLERLAESIACGEQARRIALNNGYSSEQAMIMNSLAGSYAFRVRFDKALEYFFEVLHLARAAGDSSLISSALHNIGVVHLRLENHHTSLDYFLEAKKIKEIINEVEPFELRNMSISYASLNDFENAEYYLAESIREYGSSCSEMDVMKLGFTAGLIAYCKEDYQLAIPQLLAVYNIAGNLESVRFQLDVIYLLAELYLDQGQIDKARKLLADGERLMIRGSDLNLEKLRIFRLLARMHLAFNDFRAGALYQNKYITLKDSLYDNGLTTRLMEIESEFKERENRAVIAKQTEMLALKEEVIVRQKQLNLMTALLVAIIMAFLIFILRNYRRKRKVNIVLDQLVTERTNELEMNRNRLLNKISERDLIFDRISARVKEQVTTLHALRSTATREVLDPLARQYIEKCDLASSTIERYLVLLSTAVKSDEEYLNRSSGSYEALPQGEG